MENQLDDLLGQLDDLWQAGNPHPIRDFIERARWQSMECAVELCAADLEWRWRTLSAPYAEGASIRSPAAVDYQTLLIDWWDCVDCRRPLFESEWFARSVWGDRPRIDSFLQSVNQEAVTRDSLMCKLDLAVQLEIVATLSNGDQLRQFAPASFMIGRQKQHEPAPPFLQLNVPRLVAWPISTKHVSREQLYIQRTRALELEITNLSQARSVKFNDLVLKPHQVRHIWLPFHCELEGTTLQIRQAVA